MIFMISSKNLQRKLENELEERLSMDEELAADVIRTFDCKECGERFRNLFDLKSPCIAFIYFFIYF